MAAELSIEAELAEIAHSALAPRLLLHCCCAPCASYVIEYLSRYFKITVFYYNPNIAARSEYEKRAAELQKLPIKDGYPNLVDMIICGYDPDSFETVEASFRDEPEGGMRCRACFELRLEKTAKYAKEDGFDYFTTTLTVSPHKNAAILNKIGGRLADKYGVKYLYSDFKKKDGYKRSIELSNQYGLYRQSFCGCNTSFLNSLHKPGSKKC